MSFNVHRNKLVILKLPTEETYKREFNKLGIKWVPTIENSFASPAILPLKWKVERESEDKNSFYLLDAEGIPRVAIWMSNTAYDQHARVTFLRKGKEIKDLYFHTLKINYDKEVHELRREYDKYWNILNALAPELKLASTMPKLFIPHDPDKGG